VAHLLELADLKAVVDSIFDHLVELGITNISISSEEDFYWDVPLGTTLDTKNPIKPELGVGRLSDDWEFLASILKDKDNAVSLMLIHAAPLLRHIGTKVGQ